jgi:uncharacterized paraquat-inducible protein A
MYCPVCGVESTQGLNYCKRCGANLTVAFQTTEQPPVGVALKGSHFALALASLSVGTAVVTLGGLGIVLSFVQELSHQPGDLPRLLLVLGLPMVCAISILLVWQIARLISMPRQSLGALSPPPRQQVGPFAPVQMVSPPADSGGSGGSVTEHTTRTFDPRRVRIAADDE